MLDEMSHDKTPYHRPKRRFILTRPPQPQWGYLYGIGLCGVIGLVGLAWLQAHAPHEARWAVLLGILLFYRALAYWIQSNEQAL